MHPQVQEWLGMSREELDAVYRSVQPGPLPQGDTRGTAIVTGTALARLYARFARLFAWQGKVFSRLPGCDQAGVLVNKVTPFSLTFIVATVYQDASWLDGEPTIVIDYYNTSFFASKIRDEIRQVQPGVYLGKVWFGNTRILDFALTEQR